MATIKADGVLPYKKLTAVVEFDPQTGGFVKPESVDQFGRLAIDVQALSGAQYAVLVGKLAELQVPVVGACTAPEDGDDFNEDEDEERESQQP